MKTVGLVKETHRAELQSSVQDGGWNESITSGKASDDGEEDDDDDAVLPPSHFFKQDRDTWGWSVARARAWPASFPKVICSARASNQEVRLI